jgi:hypothetical protein
MNLPNSGTATSTGCSNATATSPPPKPVNTSTRKPPPRHDQVVHRSVRRTGAGGVHKTLGTTPAVAAGVADRVWTLDDLIALLVEAESVPVKRGSYTKTRAVKREAELSN